MKNILVIIIPFLLIFSCSNQPKNIERLTHSEESNRGDCIFAGGVYLNSTVIDSSNIIVYTDSILSISRIKIIVSDLMEDYRNIYFGTTEHHSAGEEYALWTGERFFDNVNKSIIPKNRFFRNDTPKKIKKGKTKNRMPAPSRRSREAIINDD